MNDKIVTHADLDAITAFDNLPWPDGLDDNVRKSASALLRRLRAAAEADAPPLPEDWVLHFDGGHWHPYWHERGHLYKCKDVDGGTALVVRVGEGRYTRDRLTPLRPTVTEADVEKAGRAIGEHRRNGDAPYNETLARAAFAAAGVEVV